MTNSTLTLAHSELRSLVVKAARGAGLEWGLAEEAGWAAEWLARRSLPAADWATIWLAKAIEGQLDPVSHGAAMADRVALDAALPWPQPVPDDLPAPGFLLPFLHRIAAVYGTVHLTGPGGLAAAVDADGAVRFGPAWGARNVGWLVQHGAARAQNSRPEVSASIIECLEGLALRTTVPPSESSRQDAGSATPDND